jgi:hypothetical protein
MKILTNFNKKSSWIRSFFFVYEKNVLGSRISVPMTGPTMLSFVLASMVPKSTSAIATVSIVPVVVDESWTYGVEIPRLTRAMEVVSVTGL